MRGPIYEPRGAAREYAELALNIYTGCTHGCSYCYAPQILRRSREAFAACVRPREGLFFALERQLANGDFGGRTVHLCFTCDPYPRDVDHTRTREVILLLNDAGCHVQVLTKNPTAALLDLDLLDESDTVGTTVTGRRAFLRARQPRRVKAPRRADAREEARHRHVGELRADPRRERGLARRREVRLRRALELRQAQPRQGQAPTGARSERRSSLRAGNWVEATRSRIRSGRRWRRRDGEPGMCQGRDLPGRAEGRPAEGPGSEAYLQVQADAGEDMQGMWRQGAAGSAPERGDVLRRVLGRAA